MCLLTLKEHDRRLRVRNAIKVTLASVLCALISFFFHLPFGYLSPLIVIMVLVLFRGQTIGAGVPAFLACLVAGGVALGMSAALAEARFVLGLGTLIWLFAWMTFLPRFPLGRVLGGILIAMVLFSVSLGTARPEDLVLGFWSQVFIGVSVSIAFDRLVWPSRAEATLHETLAAVFEDFAAILETLDADIRERHRRAPLPDGGLSRLAAVSDALKRAFGGTSEAEFQLNFRCWLIWERLEALGRHARSQQLLAFDDALVADVEDIVSEFAGHFRELADAALRRRRANQLRAETRKKVEDLMESLRTPRSRTPGVTDQTIAAATLIKLVKHSLSDHARLVDAYNAVLDRETAIQPHATDPSGRAAGLFSWPTPDACKTSAKIVMITLVLLIGVTYLDFPGSSVVAFYGVTFGLMVNLGQLYMKGKTGILGAAAGLAYGILGVLIVVQSPHLMVLLGVYALGVFVAAYVATGDEAVSFMGLQAALLIPYVFLIFEGPEWTLTNAVTRASALAVSAGIAVVVQRLIWPVDPLSMFRAAIAKALSDMAVSWERLWRIGRCGPASTTAEQDIPEDLVLALSRCAMWLKDSQYLTGSAHVAAMRYTRVLGALEDVLAEFDLLVRVLRRGEGNRFVEEGRKQLAEPIDTIARGFEALASFYRDLEPNRELVGLPRRLAGVQDLPFRYRHLIETATDAALEDRRTASVLLHTTSEVARSLALALTETVQMLPADRTGGLGDRIAMARVAGQ